MMYGGMRGGVAFALVLLIDQEKVPHAPMFVTTTIAVVFWTSFVQGITIKPLVQWMGVKSMEEKNPTVNERLGVRFMDHAVAGIVSVIGKFEGQRQREMYRRFDDKYIKPWILRDPTAKDPKIIETFQKRIQDDAITFMKKNPTEFTQFEKRIEENPKLMTYLASIDENKPVGEDYFNVGGRPLDIRRGSRLSNRSRLSSGGFSDSDPVHNILSEHMVQPKRRRRLSSTRHSVNEADIIEETVEPSVTRHQMLQVSRKISKISQDSSTILEKGESQASIVVDIENDGKGYDNPAFIPDTEVLREDFARGQSGVLREEDKVLEDLDNVINDVALELTPPTPIVKNQMDFDNIKLELEPRKT